MDKVQIIENVSPQKLINSISWVYHGNGYYHVYMEGCGKIYMTQDRHDRDLFIATLKAKILTGDAKVN